MPSSKKYFSVNITQVLGGRELRASEGGLSSQKLNILSKYLLSDIKKLGPNTPLDIAGREAKRLIRKRTLKGIDRNGNQFKRLSGKGTRKGSNYNRKKKKALADGKITLPQGSVAPPKSNLYFSGKMLNSIGYFKDKRPGLSRFAFGLTIGLRGSNNQYMSNKALATLHHTGAGKLPSREFMGLTPNERQQVIQKFKSGLTRAFAQKLK